MEVQLTPELEQFVQSKIESGKYASASEVVTDALRALERRENALEEVRRKIQEGWDAMERGDSFDAEDVFDELIGELREEQMIKPKAE